MPGTTSPHCRAERRDSKHVSSDEVGDMICVFFWETACEGYFCQQQTDRKTTLVDDRVVPSTDLRVYYVVVHGEMSRRRPHFFLKPAHGALLWPDSEGQVNDFQLHCICHYEYTLSMQDAMYAWGKDMDVLCAWPLISRVNMTWMIAVLSFVMHLSGSVEANQQPSKFGLSLHCTRTMVKCKRSVVYEHRCVEHAVVGREDSCAPKT